MNLSTELSGPNTPLLGQVGPQRSQICRYYRQAACRPLQERIVCCRVNEREQETSNADPAFTPGTGAPKLAGAPRTGRR